MAKTKEKAGKMGLFVILISISVSLSLADDVILNVNTKRPVSVTSDKFLSFTLDPTVILTDDMKSNILSTNMERSINMAKALSPAYVRIGGPRSNSHIFKRGLFPQDNQRLSGYTFSENIWDMVHEWAGKSGLDLIACIAPQRNENGAHTSWDSRNALDLISFSDHMGYNTSWQLGYECQTRCDVPGGDLGRDVIRLRSMLDAFPRYSKSIIAGPDVVSYKTKLHQQFLVDYFNVAGPALSAITWHPDFSGVSFTKNGLSMHHDNLSTEKEDLYKVIERSKFKKPLWIAESKPEEGKKQFIGAVVWARRLGNAAKLGAQVLMRQPDNSNLFKPTPDFWVSLLHKTLVGPEVLDTKVLFGNRTHAHFYCQCTKPSSKYEKGSLTVFGINLTPTKIVASLNGLKIKELHKYILLPGFDAPNRMFAETVLLNNELLTLEKGKVVPDLKPSVSNSERGLSLKLPSGGIGFWVIPDLKLKSCMSYEEESIDKILLEKLTRHLKENENEEDAAHEDLTDLPEELWPFLWQKRMRKQHKNKFGFELEDEPLFKKLVIRKDLEKLEKLFKRNENHEDWKFRNLRNRGGFNIFENPNRDVSSEESPFFKFKKNHNIDSGEEIRAKLEKYKMQLAEYENRKNNREMWEQKSFPDEISGSKSVDTGKAIAALTLISKVENALKDMEPNKSNVKFATLKRNSNLNPENDDDVLMDEVIKTDKAKRSVGPTKIQDQFKAIYQLLSDENSFRRRNARRADYCTRDSFFLTPRNTRDLERKFGEDPLGLRRDIFRKLHKAPETRGLLGLKFRKRENDLPIFFDPKNIEGGENLYGLSYREPIKGFPIGDVYVETSEEKKNPWEDKRFFKKMKKTSGRSNLEHDLWIQEGLEPTVNVNNNLNEYGELWEAESLPNYQNYNYRPQNSNSNSEKAVTNVVKQNDYYDHKNRDTQPISYPHTNFDKDIPKSQTAHSITKKSRVRSIGEESSSFETMHYNNEQGNENKRLKREIGDINSLLNQEMFHQDDHEFQCRVIRGAKKSDDEKDLPINPDVIIIDSKENIDREELIEDGSGAHVTDEVIDIIENSPISETKITESKSTESTPTLAIGQMPEVQEELNTSTVKTINRDTRDSKPSLRQLFRQAITGKDSPTAENSDANSYGNSSNGSNLRTIADNTKSHEKGSSTGSTESSETAAKSIDKSSGSRKKVRETPGGPAEASKKPNGIAGASKSGQLSDIVGSADETKSPGATKFTLGIREPVLGLRRLDGKGIQLPKLGEQPNIEETAAKLRKSIEKANADLRSKIPPIKPLNTLKRENTDSGILTPAERLDIFKKAREIRLAALRALREEAGKIRTKKAPDVLEKTLAAEAAKLEEFKKKRMEELQHLRKQLREKRTEILKNYKPELLDVVLKNREDLEKHVGRRETGVKKIIDDLVQTMDVNLNEKFLPVPDFFKPLHDLRKRKSDIDDSLHMRLFTLPEIFRSKKNVDEEHEDESSQEDEFQIKHRLFRGIRDSFPFFVFRSRPKENFDPSDIYRPTKEHSRNVLEERYDDNFDDKTSSNEDQTWDFDGRFKRIARSVNSNSKVEVSGLKNEKKEHTRKRRDTGTQIKEADVKNPDVQNSDVMKISQEPDAQKQGSKPKSCKFLCLKEDSSEACDEFEKKLYKIVKDKDHFTALPVDNLELGKSNSKKKVSLEDQNDEKKYRSQKYDSSELNPELYPGLYKNYPIVQIMRPGIPGILGVSARQPIQNYWNDEEYPIRKSTPEMYNDYYFGMFENLPRFTRGQSIELTPKKYDSDFGIGYQKEDSKKSSNPSYSDLMRYHPLTSRPFIRERRQINNEIVKATDRSTNQVWSDWKKLQSSEELTDLKKNVKDKYDFGKSQDYQKNLSKKKTEIKDSSKEMKWMPKPFFPVLKDKSDENLKKFQTGGEDEKGAENEAMLISITVPDFTDEKDSKPSTEVEKFSDFQFLSPSLLSKMNNFVSSLRKWCSNFSV